MRLINSFSQNINLPVSIINEGDFKDNFVDNILDIRDKVRDAHDEIPVIGVSHNTRIWLKRLFGNTICYVETAKETNFWGMKLIQLDMRDGLFDFYLEG